jgi:hypothetical protein
MGRMPPMSSPDNPYLTNQERIAALQAVRQWFRLADCFPEPGQRVWVKMDDGLIELAHWDAARAGWSHSPFQRWGQPEYSAPLTQLPQPRQEPKPPQDLPISGTAPSRDRPERGPTLFPFKFLTSLLQ